MKSEKTRDFLRIPINDYAKELLAKYSSAYPERSLPPAVTNQKTNLYLKEIAELARLDEIVELEKYNGSRKVIIRKPKYEFVTTHTARRTFVTLSLEKGIRPEVVMNITGHKKYNTFQKYIKITDNVKLIEMHKAWSKNKLIAV